MTVDFGPPIRIGGSKPGGVIKIKRGGMTRNANSGTAPKRFYTPGRAIRNVHGVHQPWPPRGKPIWDPLDPFIIEYQKTHPVVRAAWRKYSAHV
jgi:hypothetical protein